jgi:succinoglycan biosynthesis protein ExoM
METEIHSRLNRAMEKPVVCLSPDGTPHICVCICTFKRPQFLSRLLEKLGEQDTGGLFSYSIVVVDNDSARSAERAVSDFTTRSRIDVRYSVAPEQNIARARNEAINNARGDFIALIDDDEFPNRPWLLTLFKALREYAVDGVLGPVTPHYDQEPPRWVIQGKFHDRKRYPTGLAIDWKNGRTGNVLFKKDVFAGSTHPFNPEFRTGEDQDFFRRMIGQGRTFVWCDEAVVSESVPPIRWNRVFMLKRALLRGSSSFLHPTSRLLSIGKSFIAVVAYSIALPFALLIRHSLFMTLLIKLFDHLGRILAFIGLNPVSQPYLTE